MPRVSRLVLENTAHHVVSRGSNRERIFRHGFDKRRYMERFNRIALEEKVLINGYCLMDNHVHWILTPSTADGLARLFRRAHTSWAMWFNRRTGRCGHLFQDRYYSTPLNENHAWTALRYVEVNPQRAGIVKRAEAFVFSSAIAHTRKDGKDPDSPIILSPLIGRRKHDYQEWREILKVPDPANTEALRRAQKGNRPFGPASWVGDLEKTHKRTLTRKAPGRPKKTAEDTKTPAAAH